MNYSDKYVEELGTESKIENKIRGKISYYTINQVADLLKEDLNKIRYYTNIFDDILKIDILNKELRYSDKDISKLELLINLKEKGMSLKEIQEYYAKLPSINEEEENFNDTNLLSVSDLVNVLIEAQQTQFAALKSSLQAEIAEANSKYVNTITAELIQMQKNSFLQLKNSLTLDIKKTLEENLEHYKNDYNDLQNEVINNVTSIISNEIDNKNNELQSELITQFNKYSQDSLKSQESLVKEVRDFKRVLNDAYYTQEQVRNENMSFVDRFLKRISLNQ